MQIVAQSATFSYSLFPSQPLISAPPPRLALPAPRVAGLLSAPMLTVRVEIDKPLTLDDLLQQIGPIRSREEMDAEIAGMVNAALQSLRDRRAAKGWQS